MYRTTSLKQIMRRLERHQLDAVSSAGSTEIFNHVFTSKLARSTSVKRKIMKQQAKQEFRFMLIVHIPCKHFKEPAISLENT